MADYIRPTPRNPVLGLLADALTGSVEWMRDPRRAQQMQGVGEMLAETGIPATMELLSYGFPLTEGRGMTTRLRPEVKAALMTLGPEAVPIGRGAMAAARAAERGVMAAGRAGERIAERVVPQVMERGGLPAQMLEGMASQTVSPLTVYHGSPYRFQRFDPTKIGSGEGAQAYGYGHYVAESPGVAKSYTQSVIRPDVSGLSNEARKIFDRASKEIITTTGNPSLATPSYTANLAASKSKNPDVVKELINYADNPPPSQGNLYTIDLPDPAIARMLDWDKPLSEQAPVVQSLIGEELKRIGGSAHTGERAYRELMFEARMQGNKSASNTMRSNAEAMAASRRLQEIGIPGIRYLDQGSRGAGQGTSNFVVFPGEEDLLRILSVNGGLLGP